MSEPNAGASNTRTDQDVSTTENPDDTAGGMPRVEASVPQVIVDALDQLVEDGIYNSRSAAIRAALRREYLNTATDGGVGAAADSSQDAPPTDGPGMYLCQRCGRPRALFGPHSDVTVCIDEEPTEHGLVDYTIVSLCSWCGWMARSEPWWWDRDDEAAHRGYLQSLGIDPETGEPLEAEGQA